MELNGFRIAVLIMVALAPVLLLRPKLLIYIYLCLIFSIPNTLGFGVKHNVEYLAFYGAGTGVMIRPLISFYLLGIFLVTLVMYRGRGAKLSECNTLKTLIALSAFYILYALFGIVSGVPIVKIFNGHSAVHIVDMTMFMLVMLKFCSNEEDLKNFSLFLVTCVAVRELFGLVRFLFFGGDISNVYAHVEGIKVTLTFQDINDNLLACLAGFYCAWMLLYCWRQLGTVTRFFYLAMVPLTLFTIMFSFRRSAWLGLCLAGVWLIVKQPIRRQVLVWIVGAAVAAFTFTTLLTMRLGQYQHSRSSLLFYDVVNRQGAITTKQGRFSELATAFETIKNNFIFGVGPWGGIDSLGRVDYMHGGVLQIWLKLGFIALLLFLFSILLYVHFYFSKLREVPPEKRGWYEAGFAGIIFMIPTFFIGTPIVEYRTMQLVGLCLALPFVVYAINREKRHQAATSEIPGYPQYGG